MKKPKQKKKKNNVWGAVLTSARKIVAVFVIVGMNWNGLGAVMATIAYYNDVQNSSNNLFTASSLDNMVSGGEFDSGVDPDTDAVATTTISNMGGLDDFYYRLVSATSTDDLCGMLDLTAAAGSYSDTQPLSTFDYSPGKFSEVGGDWIFTASLQDGAVGWEGKTCSFGLVFTASQNNGGAGYFDVETLDFTIFAVGARLYLWIYPADFNRTAFDPGDIEIFTDTGRGGKGEARLVGAAEAQSIDLRPDSDSDASQLAISSQPVGNTKHSIRVNEPAANDDTYVSAGKDQAGQVLDDLYGADYAPGAGPISRVTVYSRCNKTGGSGNAYNILKTHDTAYYSPFFAPETSYSIYPGSGELSSTYDQNPYTDQPWTWEEINAMQIGVRLNKTDNSNHELRCSQVWAVVDYIKTSYPARAEILSDAAGGGSTTDWNQLIWSGDLPGAASIKFSVASTNNSDCSAISSWPVTSRDNTIDLSGLPASNYICWKAELSSGTDRNSTPILREVKITTASEIAFASIQLNEFLPDSSTGGEWIEIYNLSENDVDLNGWSVETDSESTMIDRTTADLANGVIPAHGFLLVNLPDGALDNMGDSVRLLNLVQETVDFQSYGDCPNPAVESGFLGSFSCQSVPADKSFARIPDGDGPWFDPMPTPGASNVLEGVTEAEFSQATTTENFADNLDIKDGAAISEDYSGNGQQRVPLADGSTLGNNPARPEGLPPDIKTVEAGQVGGDPGKGDKDISDGLQKAEIEDSPAGTENISTIPNEGTLDDNGKGTEGASELTTILSAETEKNESGTGADNKAGSPNDPADSGGVMRDQPAVIDQNEEPAIEASATARPTS